MVLADAPPTLSGWGVSNQSLKLRASGIARRRTEEERAEAFFPL